MPKLIFAVENSISKEAKYLFKEHCSACHLDNGYGLKSMNVASIAGLPRWYVTQQLRHFRDGKRGAHPEDKEGELMQNMTQVLDDKKVAFLGKHVQSMKPLEKRQTLKVGNFEKGKVLYKNDCASCHGESAQGKRSEGAPPLNVQIDWYLHNQMKKFNGRIRSHQGGKNVSIGQMYDLTQYLSSLKD
jgi:cytochrome c oxidase subunit 2